MGRIPSFRAPIATLLISGLLLALASSCAKSLGTASGGDDGSASGMAAAAVGGTVNATESGGTQALRAPAPSQARFSLADLFGARLFRGVFGGIFDTPSAWASAVCPTFATAGTGCSAAGGVMTLTYDDCSFTGSTAIWDGSQEIQVAPGTLSCGAFPTGSGNWSLTRTFGGSIAGDDATTRTATTGVELQVDTSNNLPVFNGQVGVGGGFTISFSGTQRTQIAVNGIRVISESSGSLVLDYGITTAVTASGAAGTPLSIDDSGASKVVTGTATIYHNLVQAIGTASFQSVTFAPDCCTPTSGEISTTYTSSTDAAYNGHTETLRFTGCGTATLTTVRGQAIAETLPHCL